MRSVGWLIVVLGLMYFVVGLLWSNKPNPLPPPGPEEILAIAEAPEGRRGELLAILAERLPRANVQVSLMQGVPESPAVILTGEVDSSGDETATHWPSPWPELNRVLGSALREATTVRDAYAGRRFTHHIYPVNPAENHFLVITETAIRDDAGRAFRWFVLAVSLGLAATLWFVRQG